MGCSCRLLQLLETYKKQSENRGSFYVQVRVYLGHVDILRTAVGLVANAETRDAHEATIPRVPAWAPRARGSLCGVLVVYSFYAKSSGGRRLVRSQELWDSFLFVRNVSSRTLCSGPPNLEASCCSLKFAVCLKSRYRAHYYIHLYYLVPGILYQLQSTCTTFTDDGAMVMSLMYIKYRHAIQHTTAAVAT